MHHPPVIICVRDLAWSRLGPDRSGGGLGFRWPDRLGGATLEGVEAGAVRDTSDVDGRYLAVDERGIGLRATWRPGRGFVNLSLWRGDQCVETFHLKPRDVATLVAFLVSRLASAAREPAPALSLVEQAPPRDPRRFAGSWRQLKTDVRSRVTTALERAATRIAP